MEKERDRICGKIAFVLVAQNRMILFVTNRRIVSPIIIFVTGRLVISMLR